MIWVLLEELVGEPMKIQEITTCQADPAILRLLLLNIKASGIKKINKEVQDRRTHMPIKTFLNTSSIGGIVSVRIFWRQPQPRLHACRRGCGCRQKTRTEDNPAYTTWRKPQACVVAAPRTTRAAAVYIGVQKFQNFESPPKR